MARMRKPIGRSIEETQRRRDILENVHNTKNVPMSILARPVSSRQCWTTNKKCGANPFLGPGWRKVSFPPQQHRHCKMLLHTAGCCARSSRRRGSLSTSAALPKLSFPSSSSFPPPRPEEKQQAAEAARRVRLWLCLRRRQRRRRRRRSN